MKTNSTKGLSAFIHRISIKYGCLGWRQYDCGWSFRIDMLAYRIIYTHSAQHSPIDHRFFGRTFRQKFANFKWINSEFRQRKYITVYKWIRSSISWSPSTAHIFRFVQTLNQLHTLDFVCYHRSKKKSIHNSGQLKCNSVQ